MPSQVQPSTINAQFPVPGVNQPSQGFRSNFLAIQNAFSQYVAEMNDLINKAIVSAPLQFGANTAINNFGGMQNSNLSLMDYGYVTSNIVAGTSNSVPTLNFANTAVANIVVSAASPTVQTINIANFPGLGYSEMWLQIQTSNPPQFFNFAAIVPGAALHGGSKLSGFNTSTANFTLASTDTHLLKIGSSDGLNWNISGSTFAIARSTVPPSSIGAPGDSTGMIAQGSGNVYVCTGNYDGTTHIWKFATLSAF